MALVSNLFHVDEKTQQDLLRASKYSSRYLVWNGCCEKRYRHFLELWQQTDPTTEPELAVLLPVSVHRTATAAKLDRQRTIFPD